MNSDDRDILRAVQKNADMAIKTIGALTEKTVDGALSHELAKEKLMYSIIQNKATDRLNNGQEDSFAPSMVTDMVRTGSIHMSTIADCSDSHIAELMIANSGRGLTGMWKSVNSHGNSGNTSMEIARELIAFEEKSMVRLKKFL